MLLRSKICYYSDENIHSTPDSLGCQLGPSVRGFPFLSPSLTLPVLLLAFVRLLLGTFTRLRIPHTRPRRSSASSGDSLLAPLSTAAMVSVRGSLERAGAKINPSFNTSSWAGVSVRSVRLTTHLSGHSRHSSHCLDQWLVSLSSFSICVRLVSL